MASSALEWEMWREYWEHGLLPDDLMKAIDSLRDADGSPLPPAATRFLLNVLNRRIKPRKLREGARFVPSVVIREAYKYALLGARLEQCAPGRKVRGATPSEVSIERTATFLGISPGAVSMAVHPRRGRKGR